jgi:hypothetical protein
VRKESDEKDLVTAKIKEVKVCSVEKKSSNLSLKDDSREEMNFFQLRNNLQKKGKIEKKDINGIITTMIKDRVTTESAISLKIMAKMIFSCIFCQTKNRKQINIYNKGVDRFYKELDIINILKNVRLSKVFMMT